RANVCPTREFLARGRQEMQIKSCWHCLAENVSTAHMIGCCPAGQDARIKRHNQICELLANEARKKEWVVFQETQLKDKHLELYKPDSIFVKGDQAFVVDVTVRYESKPASLANVAAEKAKKYEHLKDRVQELTSANTIKFMGFPLGARGKWYHGNYELLTELGLSTSRREKVARSLSRRALFTSVDNVHIFASQ
ncbi:hypothetical protein N337_03181, partial [Phoenicopterus ruber ruber]